MTSIFIYFHLFSVFQSAWAYGERPIHKRLTDLKRIQKPLQRRKILWISFLLFFLFFFLEKNNQFPLAMAADEELELRVGHAMQLPLMVRTERGHGLHLVWDWLGLQPSLGPPETWGLQEQDASRHLTSPAWCEAQHQMSEALSWPSLWSSDGGLRMCEKYWPVI